jgi:hypothetical protein
MWCGGEKAVEPGPPLDLSDGRPIAIPFRLTETTAFGVRTKGAPAEELHEERSEIMATLNLKCSKSGKPMEVLRPKGMSEPPSKLLRICPYCGTLAWNNEDGSVETRTPHRVNQ